MSYALITHNCAHIKQTANTTDQNKSTRKHCCDANPHAAVHTKSGKPSSIITTDPDNTDSKENSPWVWPTDAWIPEAHLDTQTGALKTWLHPFGSPLMKTGTIMTASLDQQEQLFLNRLSSKAGRQSFFKTKTRAGSSVLFDHTPHLKPYWNLKVCWKQKLLPSSQLNFR